MNPISTNRNSPVCAQNSANQIQGMRFAKALTGALTLFTLLALPVTSHAALLFTLDQSALTGQPGNTLMYTGTLMNTGTNTLFLNSDTFSLAASGLTLDDSPFLNNFPLSLSSGQSASGDLFDVSIGSSVPDGFYSGSFTIQGGTQASSFTSLATQTFSANVASSAASAPEPEAQTLMLCGGAVLGFVGTVRRRRLMTGKIAL